MTVIEIQTMQVIKTSFPVVVYELKRIANALEEQNSLKKIELTRCKGLDLDEVDMEESK